MKKKKKKKKKKKSKSGSHGLARVNFEKPFHNVKCTFRLCINISQFLDILLRKHNRDSSFCIYIYEVRFSETDSRYLERVVWWLL